MTVPHGTSDRMADLEAEVAALKADNARLRRLLDEEGMPDSLRHAFRDTVALLRTVMRCTADSAIDVESYDAHLGGRLDIFVRVRSLTDTLGEADLHTLVADALATYLVYEGEQATIAGPKVWLRPKPAQVFALALHELATNAVEHGLLGRSVGAVSVTWQIEQNEGVPTLELLWQETGAGTSVEPSRRGFGTMVVEDMLAYDLGASAELTYEPHEVRCRISFPLDAATGRFAEDGARNL